MLKSNVVSKGIREKETYPQVKQCKNYSTYALFSSESDAVIIAVDDKHSHDWVGRKVENISSSEWVKVSDFEILIKG